MSETPSCRQVNGEQQNDTKVKGIADPGREPAIFLGPRRDEVDRNMCFQISCDCVSAQKI